MVVKYKDLDWKLKVAVIVGWIVGIINAVAFLYGFWLGLTGGY